MYTDRYRCTLACTCTERSSWVGDVRTDSEIQSAFSWPARVHFLALCKRALMSGTWKKGGIEDASSRCFFFFSCHLIFILLDFSKVCAAFCQPLWNSFCLEYKVRCYKITRTFKRTSLLILCIYISSKRCANRGWKFTKFTQYINKFNFTKDYKRSIPLHNSVNINRQIFNLCSWSFLKDRDDRRRMLCNISIKSVRR